MSRFSLNVIDHKLGVVDFSRDVLQSLEVVVIELDMRGIGGQKGCQVRIDAGLLCGKEVDIEVGECKGDIGVGGIKRELYMGGVYLERLGNLDELIVVSPNVGSDGFILILELIFEERCE